MQKNQFFKGKEQSFRIRKIFYTIDIQLEGREAKIKREIEELFLNVLLCLWMIWISLSKNLDVDVHRKKIYWYNLRQ